jgi:hypothetical protein
VKRSLRRHIEAAINRSWNSDRDPSGQVTVVLSFPENAFPDAPIWSPGPDFEMTAEECAWLRDNHDGTSTAVVCGVGPKELPAADGGRWTVPEVWTVTAPSYSHQFTSGDLWDKPHRITWLLREPGAIIHREPYAGHPSQAVDDYWTAFYDRWGFVPGRMTWGRFPYADRRRWVALYCRPGWANRPGERRLLEAAVLLARTFGATARVYSAVPGSKTGATRGPIPSAHYDASLINICDRLPQHNDGR